MRGACIRGALIASSIWWLFYAIGSSRTEAEMPRLDTPAFNDRFSDWVAVEPPKAKTVETEVISVKPIELTPVTYIRKAEPEPESAAPASGSGSQLIATATGNAGNERRAS